MAEIDESVGRVLEGTQTSGQSSLFSEPETDAVEVEDSSQLAGENLEGKAASEWDDAMGSDEQDAGAQTPELSDDIDDLNLQQAFEAGMSIQEARSFGSATALQAAVNALTRQRQQMSDRVRKAQPPEKQADAVELFKPLQINTENLDDDARSVVDKMNSYYSEQGQQAVAQNQALAKELSNMKKFLASQVVESRQKEFDSLLEKHGEPFREKLGSGPSSALSKDSPEYLARKRVSDAMNMAHQLANGSITPEQALINGLRAAFADQAQQIERDKVRQDIRKQNAGKVGAKPTSRQSTGKEDGRQRAARRWDKAIRG